MISEDYLILRGNLSVKLALQFLLIVLTACIQEELRQVLREVSFWGPVAADS